MNGLEFHYVCQVPMYMAAQCGGSVTAAFALRWILHPAAYEGATLPAGSDMQSFLLEIVITFILMFVVAAVATDTRAVSHPLVEILSYVTCLYVACL